MASEKHRTVPLLLKGKHLHHALGLLTLAWCFALPAQANSEDIAKQAVASGDSGGKIFAIIDKAAATVSVFDATGNRLATSPVLVGQAMGDESVPGIGERPMQNIAVHERTTPAGRFASEPGVNLAGETIVWIDYNAAVSMHRLRPSKPSEKRPARMASATPLDNRITYGCVNVPVAFYERWILPTFGQTAGVVYVLPETRPAKDVFHFLR